MKVLSILPSDSACGRLLISVMTPVLNMILSRAPPQRPPRMILVDLLCPTGTQTCTLLPLDLLWRLGLTFLTCPLPISLVTRATSPVPPIRQGTLSMTTVLWLLLLALTL